jgi:hypothetical protein
MPQITAVATSSNFGCNNRGSNGAHWQTTGTSCHHIEPPPFIISAADLSNMPWL